MTTAAPFSTKTFVEKLDRFFFARTDPAMLNVVATLRIAFAALSLFNAFVLAPDLEMFFGQNGVLSYDASRTITDPHALTIFSVVQSTPGLWICFLLFVAQNICLLAGLYSRVQIVCVFLWLVSFHHRNYMIFDGEDTVFRMLAFLLCFLPLGARLSVDRLLAQHRQQRTGKPIVDPQRFLWGLRLVQIQMTLIYVSTVWEKVRGTEWLDGIAVYYVSRLDDFFGRFPLPSFLFESRPLVALMTWSVVLVEAALPIGLWFKETRRAAVVTGILFHLAIDYAMNLLLFQWIMIAGLLAFVEPDDWVAARALFRRIARAKQPAVPDVPGLRPAPPRGIPAGRSAVN